VEKETPTVLGPLKKLTSITEPVQLALSKGPNKVGVSLPSPGEGKRSSFRNVVFSSYLEFWTMDKVYESSESECYAPSSEIIMS
jgi:hypothetical protein